ncbi:MAG TPA: hypothetical protein VK524_17815 [Polyangiaceae bacterium]|nr:hypothetical protein [Polyangiaceae bacterium]
MTVRSGFDLKPVLACGLAALMLSCGSSKPARTAPATSNGDPSASDAAGAGTEDAHSASSSKQKKTVYARAPVEKPDEKTREIQYVVTQEGLEVRIEGVHFLANVRSQRVRNGWGVRLDVSATVKDDASHSLLTPGGGPLALAGTVQRGGKTDKFGDERRGDGSLELVAGKERKWTRTWPDKQTQPLAQGQSLELQVGLWGIGASADERRPVQNFFHVKMDVGPGKPQAQIGPPPTAKREQR